MSQDQTNYEKKVTYSLENTVSMGLIFKTLTLLRPFDSLIWIFSNKVHECVDFCNFSEMFDANRVLIH